MYQELVEKIVDSPLTEEQKNGKDFTKIGYLYKQDNWLKIYDIRSNKVLYVAKQPVTTGANKNELLKAGVVHDLGKLDLSTFYPKTDDKITTIQLQPQYKILKGYDSYVGKAVKIKDRWFIVRLLRGTRNQNSFIDESAEFKNEMFYNSEWNRYILPLVKENRYKDSIDNVIEASLKEKNENDDNYKIQLSNYNYIGDMTPPIKYVEKPLLGDYLKMMQGKATLTQENKLKILGFSPLVRGVNPTGGISDGMYNAASKGISPQGDASPLNAFRPVLEEIPQNCYDGACFEGEVAGTDFITYKELLENIEGKSLETLPKDTTTNKPKTKVGDVLDLGNDEATGGNWLKIEDYKNNSILYIAKKPITNKVSWNMLFNAGVVYGLDQIDVKADGTLVVGSNYTGKYGYKPKEIIVNGKKYIIRLLKGRMLTVNDGDVNKGLRGNALYDRDVYPYTEWTRYVVPLIDIDGNREGKYSSDGIDKELQLKTSENEYKYETAKYKWFKDLTLQEGKNKLNEYVGQSSWTQESIFYNSWNRTYSRVVRGDSSFNYCSTDGREREATSQDSEYGFRLVLEEIKE